MLSTKTSFVKSIIGAIEEEFGHPSSLHGALNAHPELRVVLDEPPQLVAAGSRVPWHEWGSAPADHWPRRVRGDLRGWRRAGNAYESFRINREEFAHFGIVDVTEGWECDIQEVVGLSSSKSDLMSFQSLDEMVETNAQALIEPVSEAMLRENLAWEEIRLLHRENSSDYFARYCWDGRLFLMNDGGSHHFAAARYIAARLSIPVPLRGRLRTFAISESAVSSLQRDFDMFALSDEPTAQSAFHKAMERFDATYLWQFLPRPYGTDSRAILLPRSERRSAKVASVLREAGFVDLGAHLQGLISRQRCVVGEETRPKQVMSSSSGRKRISGLAL